MGDSGKLVPGSLANYIIQKHLAERAGKHYDFRIESPEGLLSWATRKEFPEPGKKIQLFQQPLHEKEYAQFEGEITEGYGKGTVEKYDEGKVFIKYVSPRAIKLVVAHKKYPEYFTLVKLPNKAWLMSNTTPVDPVAEKKPKYKVIPADQVQQILSPDNYVSAKIDGSSGLYRLLKDSIEALSFRVSKTGKPIVHTERVLGEDATKKLNIPKELQGTVLRGEVYGTRNGKAIPMQELNALLNATLANSLNTQKEKGIELKNAIFDIVQRGKSEIGSDVPYEEKQKMIQEALQYLPKNKFHTFFGTRDPQEQQQLWQDVQTGKHPLTSEGIVSWPAKGGKPSKVKTQPESDVIIREIVEGQGKYKGVGAGAFKYSIDPEGPILGNVGTGFTDETRKAMMERPDDFLGRVAKIRAQSKFPSGAYRTPAFLGLHEDYPVKGIDMNQETLSKVSSLLNKLAEGKPRMGSHRLAPGSKDHLWKNLGSNSPGNNLRPWQVGRKVAKTSKPVVDPEQEAINDAHEKLSAFLNNDKQASIPTPSSPGRLWDALKVLMTPNKKTDTKSRSY